MRATAPGGVPTLKAAVYGLDPAREERGERRADSSSCSPLLLGRGAVAHIRAHALHSSSCCFPSPQASATPPVLVPYYLPGSSLLVCSSISSLVCVSVLSPCACLHKQPCLCVLLSVKAQVAWGCLHIHNHLCFSAQLRLCTSPCVCLPVPACVSTCISLHWPFLSW